MFDLDEFFLHYIWRYLLLSHTDLRTDSDISLTILSTGLPNKDSGPDFYDARIKLDNTIWVGCIEIHVHSSDWYHHQHHLDPAYDSTILHVVYEIDREVRSSRNQIIPQLELKGRIPGYTLKNYKKLRNNRNRIHCQNMDWKLSALEMKSWHTRLAVSRIENKSNLINQLLDQHKNDFERVLFILISRYFGSSVNREPMQWLMESIPFEIILKHQDDSFKIEALLFGQSGFPGVKDKDEYLMKLRSEYGFLAHKYELKPMNATVWKWGKLRPPSLPTIRIAQLASFLAQPYWNFDRLIRSFDLNYWNNSLAISASSYWTHHSQFGRMTRPMEKKVGSELKNNVVINAIVPVMFQYGKFHSNADLIDQSLQILEGLGPEKNNITKLWERNGIFADSALESQSLIELTTNFCDEFKCLKCAIGKNILQTQS